MNKRIRLYRTITLAIVLVPATLQARYLNPNTGRFYTMDTYEGDASEPLSLHKYLYGADDPVNRVDPSGRMTMTELLSVTSIITTLAASTASTLSVGAVAWHMDRLPDSYGIGFYASTTIDGGFLGLGPIGGGYISFHPREMKVTAQVWTGAEATASASAPRVPHLHPEGGFFETWTWGGKAEEGGQPTSPFDPYLMGGDFKGLLAGFGEGHDQFSLLFGVSHSTEPGMGLFAVGAETTPLYVVRTMTKDEMIGTTALLHSTLNAMIAFEGVAKLGKPVNGIGLLAGAAVNSAFTSYWVNKTYGRP